MVWVAVRINEIDGIPLDEEGEVKTEGWEISDAEETMIYVQVDDIWDIENGIQDVRDILTSWHREEDNERSNVPVQG